VVFGHSITKLFSFQASLELPENTQASLQAKAKFALANLMDVASLFNTS